MKCQECNSELKATDFASRSPSVGYFVCKECMSVFKVNFKKYMNPMYVFPWLYVTFLFVISTALEISFGVSEQKRQVILFIIFLIATKLVGKTYKFERQVENLSRVGTIGELLDKVKLKHFFKPVFGLGMPLMLWAGIVSTFHNCESVWDLINILGASIIVGGVICGIASLTYFSEKKKYKKLLKEKKGSNEVCSN